jgi:hypothetical protein
MRRAAVDFYFGIFVERAVGAAVGIEAQVTRGDSFGVDDFPLVGFKVLMVCAHAEAGTVIGVAVEKSAHVVGKVGVVGDLRDDGAINLGRVMRVPDDDSVNLLG